MTSILGFSDLLPTRSIDDAKRAHLIGNIHITLVRAPGRIATAVRDAGLGMTPEQLARVGERFWRAGQSGRLPGAGPGLAIAQEILQLPGGRLCIERAPGRGSTFTAWLPTAEEPPSADRGGAAPTGS